MPTLSDVYRFLDDPSTSVSQLRSACELLGLDSSGNLDDLHMRLGQYLAGYSPEAPISGLSTELEPASEDMIGRSMRIMV